MIFAFLLVLCAVIANGAKEGEKCFKDGVEATCANIRECPAAHEDIKNRRKPQICEFGGIDPIVCCIASDTVTPAPARPRPSTTVSTSLKDTEANLIDGKCDPIPDSLTSKPTGRKAWDKCLEYQKIVFPCGFRFNYHAIPPSSGWSGYSRANHCHHNAEMAATKGGEAEPKQFPHMVVLGYGNETNLEWLCGGSLVSDQFILTAGHCAYSRSGGPVAYVQVGMHRRSVMPLRNRYKVKNIIRHPEYNPPSKYNDIALLELEKPVPLDESTVPACIHTGGEADDTYASVTGWGSMTREGNPAETLQEKTMINVNGRVCAYVYEVTRLMKNGLDTKSQSCYTAKIRGRDACQGDSGGPLQIKNMQISCMYTILGITSFGKDCGAGLPGIYTTVAPFAEWIEATVWP